MAKEINTSSLMDAASVAEADDRPTVIDVEHVSMVFNIANQQLNNLKEYAIALMRRELMFKEFVALDDVSLQVKKGDVFGILGTNGSGKSTLLKIIAGVLEPTRGTVAIHGTIAPLIELGAGFDFELTARENIYLNGALLGYPRKFIDEHFDDIVDFAEIGDFLDMPIKNYSSGMVARIAFAIATVIVPDILIVDEVLSVGDFMFQQKCEQKIQSLINEHGVTVLIVSHNNDQIERLCNKAIWIEKGHTRIMGTAEEVCGIYRALGGHTGSAESEAVVLDLLANDASTDDIALETIAAETRYGANARLFHRSFGDAAPETLVVASGEDLPVHLLATAAAKSLGGGAVVVKPDAMSDVTAALLAQVSPRRMVILDCADGIDAETRESVAAAVDAGCETVVLAAPNLAVLSQQVFAYLCQNGASFGSVAFLSGYRSGMVSASVAPYLSHYASPLIFVAPGEHPSEELLAMLRAQGIRDLVLLGDISADETLLQHLSTQGFEAVHLSGASSEEANAVASSWLIERHRTAGLPLNTLVVVGADGISEAYSAAAFAAQEHAIVFLVNHNDLNSMARIISFIDQQGGAIDRLIVVGNDSAFNAIDRIVLKKAIARAKTSAGGS